MKEIKIFRENIVHSARKQTVGKMNAHDAAHVRPAGKWTIEKMVV